MTGKKEKDLIPELPSMDSVIKNYFLTFLSNYPLLTLGRSVENNDEITISQEERYVNFQILGAPGEGKSKLLEYHIREDIKLGNGLCLLDPTDGGDTARNVLNYCASINYQKVIVIDPLLAREYNKIACIAPLNENSLDKSVEGVMEALAILFKSDYTIMRKIRLNLSALLRILTRQKLTLNETLYFSEQGLDKDKRAAILQNDRDSYRIDNLFRSESRFDEKFSSTINMLDVLWREPLFSILGNNQGIDFKRAIADGWVILVNLSSYAMTEEQSELLGVLIISQIMQALDSLVNSPKNEWKGKYYLYIDEAGFFATPQLKTLLLRKRKSGMVLYLAHHDYQQFEGRKDVLSAIEGAARIKLMLNTVGYDDRMRMVKSLGYGGDIPPTLASYANQDLPKQHAVLKKNKETPVRIKIPDVSEVPPAPREYIESLLNNEWYKDARSLRTNPESSQSRKVDDDQPTGASTVSGGVRRKPKDNLQSGEQKPANPPERKPIKI